MTRSQALESWGDRSPVIAKGARGRDCSDHGDHGGHQGGEGGHGGGQGGGQGDCGCHRPPPPRDHGPHCDCRRPCACQCRCGGQDGCGCHDRRSAHDEPEPRQDRPREGTFIGWKNPDRPGRHCGTSTGLVPGGRLDPCDFATPPWNEWPGDRADLWLPFLFMRANAGDHGARPVVGPFWESPDILLLADTDPAVAPPVPPDLGQTAIANRPTTLYAHVWNFGLSAAPNVVVEFSWCDPSLGIGPAGANRIGFAKVSLGARGSGRSHAVVKCTQPWFPTFVNGGHECLVVRIWEETSDGLGDPAWDAALNRHVAQRNIHVAVAGEGLHPMARALGEAMRAEGGFAPLTLNVGPLFGQTAQVAVERVAPHGVPWLQQRTGVRGQFPAQAPPTGVPVLGAPTTIGGGPGSGTATEQDVDGDDQQVELTTGDEPPAPGQAHVYRVTASQQGEVFGGYTVVLLG